MLAAEQPDLVAPVHAAGAARRAGGGLPAPRGRRCCARSRRRSAWPSSTRSPRPSGRAARRSRRCSSTGSAAARGAAPAGRRRRAGPADDRRVPHAVVPAGRVLRRAVARRWDTEGGGPDDGPRHPPDRPAAVDPRRRGARWSPWPRGRPGRPRPRTCRAPSSRSPTARWRRWSTACCRPRETSYLRFDFEHATVELSHLYGYGDDDWTVTGAPATRRRSPRAGRRSRPDGRAGTTPSSPPCSTRSTPASRRRWRSRTPRRPWSWSPRSTPPRSPGGRCARGEIGAGFAVLRPDGRDRRAVGRDGRDAQRGPRERPTPRPRRRRVAARPPWPTRAGALRVRADGRPAGVAPAVLPPTAHPGRRRGDASTGRTTTCGTRASRWSLPNVGPANFWGGPTYLRDRGYAAAAQQRRDAPPASTRPASTRRRVGRGAPGLGHRAGRDLVHRASRLAVRSRSSRRGAWMLAFETTFTNVSGPSGRVRQPDHRGPAERRLRRPVLARPAVVHRRPVSCPARRGGDELMGVRAPWLAFTRPHDEHGRRPRWSGRRSGQPGHPTQWFVRSEPVRLPCARRRSSTPRCRSRPGDAVDCATPS